MKKKYLTLFLFPLILSSCGANSLSVDQMKQKVSSITDYKYPYYKVIGSLDFNGEVIQVMDTFDQAPGLDTFVPYSRYNEGFYNATIDTSETPENIVIYGMASKSYWLRAPLRITNDNVYIEVENEDGSKRENTTCAHYLLEHIITSYIGQTGATNPSKNQMKMVELADGGFAFVGEKVHTKFTIDNYPYYPDYEHIPELGGWFEDDPLQCYKSVVNAKVNVRLEYNAQGWLTKEYLTSLEYDYSVNTPAQVSLQAIYSYSFGA